MDMRHIKMINLDSIIDENNKKHEKWPYIPDHWWFWIRKNKHIT